MENTKQEKINQKVQEILMGLNDLWLLLPVKSIARDNIVPIERAVKALAFTEEDTK